MKGAKPKEPDLEDLREAGDIEQDADIVGMLHLPAYYKQYLSDEECEEWRNKGMFIIRKSREGIRNDTALFEHDQRYKKIWDVREKAKQTEIEFIHYYEPQDREGEDSPF